MEKDPTTTTITISNMATVADRMPPALRLRIARRKNPQRAVERAISVPGLTRGPAIKGSVWAVTVVKDEADIVGHAIRHLLGQGVDRVIAIDNGSTDGTIELLDQIAGEDVRVHVGTDRQAAFMQGRKVSYLAHLAWRAGADWVIPFDADEFWFAPGMPVTDFLRGTSAHIVSCAMHDVTPTAESEELVFGDGRPVHVDATPRRLHKVAFRTSHWQWIADGNHALIGRQPDGSGLRLLHYNYRSLSQIYRKTHNGADAVKLAADLSDDTATHWKALARLSLAETEEAWRAHRARAGVNLDGDARGARIRVPDPALWRTWDPRGLLGVAGPPS